MKLIESNILFAIKYNIPLITTSNDFYKSIYQNAALYTAMDEKDIAEKMMLLYKDEQLRNDLINYGKHLSASFTWDKTAGHLWDVLQAGAE